MAVDFKRHVIATVDVFTDDEQKRFVGSIIKTGNKYAYRHESTLLLSAATMKQIAYEIEFLEGLTDNV